MNLMARLFMLLVALTALSFASASSGVVGQVVYRIDHVTDGDTVVQERAEGTARPDRHAEGLLRHRLLRPADVGHGQAPPAEGVRVRLLSEPRPTAWTTSGGSLRYTSCERTAWRFNVRLVAVGAAAPYFCEGRRGQFCRRRETLAKRARAKGRGLWGACPHRCTTRTVASARLAASVPLLRLCSRSRGTLRSQRACDS